MFSIFHCEPLVPSIGAEPMIYASSLREAKKLIWAYMEAQKGTSFAVDPGHYFDLYWVENGDLAYRFTVGALGGLSGEWA